MEKSKNVEICNKYRELINYLSCLGEVVAISYPDDHVQVRIADTANNDLFKFILTVPKGNTECYEDQYIG